MADRLRHHLHKHHHSGGGDTTYTKAPSHHHHHHHHHADNELIDLDALDGPDEVEFSPLQQHRHSHEKQHDGVKIPHHHHHKHLVLPDERQEQEAILPAERDKKHLEHLACVRIWWLCFWLWISLVIVFGLVGYLVWRHNHSDSSNDNNTTPNNSDDSSPLSSSSSTGPGLPLTYRDTELEFATYQGVGVTPSQYSTSGPLLAELNYIPRYPLYGPPLGWNSWDNTHFNLNESRFRAEVQAALSLGFKQAGFRYMVIDDRWAVPMTYPPTASDAVPYPVTTVDSLGRQQPDPTKWPSSVASNGTLLGFKPLADWVHQQDMLVGIHVITGVPIKAVVQNPTLPNSQQTISEIIAPGSGEYCKWCQSPGQYSAGPSGTYTYYYFDPSQPGAQEYLDLLFQQYAQWGLDFVKVDCLVGFNALGDESYHSSTVYMWEQTMQMYQNAVAQAGRPMLLSLSPGNVYGTGLSEVNSINDGVSQTGHLYRQSQDVWDSTGGASGQNSYPGTVWQYTFNVFGVNIVAEKWAGQPMTDNAYPRVDFSWPDLDMIPAGGAVVQYNNWYAPTRLSLWSYAQQQAVMTMYAIFRVPLIIGGDLLQPDATSLAIWLNPDLVYINQFSGNASTSTPASNVLGGMANRVDKGLYWTAYVTSATSTTSVTFYASDHGFSMCTFRELWLNKMLGMSVASVTSVLPASGGTIVELSNCS